MGDFSWLPQVIVTVLSVGGLGAFWATKFKGFDERLDKFEGKIDSLKDKSADSNKEIAVRLAKFDEHSRVQDRLDVELKTQEKSIWDLDKKVSRIFSILDNKDKKDGVYKKQD